MSVMKPIRTSFCILLILCAGWLPVLGEDLDAAEAEVLRIGMTIATAGIGLATGSAIAIGFSLDAINTPLSNTLLLTIPVAAAGVASGALAGRWIADTALKNQSSPLFSILEGSWRGLCAGAFIGSITFSTNFAIGYHVLDVPEGYWGNPPIPRLAMAAVAGGVWGGIFGALAGAVSLPIVALLMGF